MGERRRGWIPDDSTIFQYGANKGYVKFDDGGSRRIVKNCRALVGSLELAKLFRGREPQPFVCVTSCSAARTLPSIINLEIILAVPSSLFCFLCRFLVNCLWIVRPSCTRSSNFPSNQSFRRRSKWRVCSFAFDLELGFCRSRAGIVIAAFMATHQAVSSTKYEAE